VENKHSDKQFLGKSSIEYKTVASILTKATGFMSGYDYTLNQYSGCSFGCTYCYAAFFSNSQEKRDNWGNWIEVKENALSLLKKKRKRPLKQKTIYMSSVTDPYQPIEKELELTRSLLKELIDYHDVRLVIQTRSGLITRDIDLFKQFSAVQVNMTITTDSEIVRKVFEPLCSSNSTRVKAIKEVNAAGINCCITITPLLPVENPVIFIDDLLRTGVKKFIIQPFHVEKGNYVAGTRESAVRLLKELNWNAQRYKEVESLIKLKIPDICIGKIGFNPI
jgi:DNA repair photolyase